MGKGRWTPEQGDLLAKLSYAWDGKPNLSTGPSSTRHPLYQTWLDMKRRCYDPKRKAYPNYGGRGIYVCDRWLGDFSAFVKDMGLKPTEEHTLDRIDNDGPYSPENCRWALPAGQTQNKRPRHDAILVTEWGETKSLKRWSEDLGVSVSALWKRYNKKGHIRKYS